MINKVIAYFLISIVVLVIKPEVFGQKSPKTLEQLPKKSSELYKKVQAETNKRNYAEAIILLDKLIKNEPDFVDGYLRKAGIFYTQKNFKEAIELLSFSINNYPNYDNEMYFSRGLIHFEDRNYALAKLDFENFLDFEKLNKVRIDKAETKCETRKYT
jgi:tetratricopeptide (TPR) repeat protein